ncbi:helix-turn-helix domain-containing protein [Pseudotabrizicola sp. 4114]|uniref:TetR/AcrR family transcriptional regulator n=1 Tax=Pseudotabrizicola sp. 4114 TaxID=2817731 RepID=UPI00285DFA8F|nr:AcrR family transcriptional regulator [Pseudorhodobacter sp. 4114]
MTKKTQPEIAAEIIDCAAGLFARHGLEGTSLQQIADGTGYTKAGVLHHYPSKRAIYDAVIETSREGLKGLLAKVEAVPIGADRDRAVIEAAVDLTFAWPGVSAFGNKFIHHNQSDDPDMVEMGETMSAALGLDLESADLDRVVRVSTALAGLGLASLLAVQLDQKREWRPHLVGAAMNALGH